MICSVDQDVVVADTDTKPLGGGNVSFVSSYGLCGAQRIERSSHIHLVHSQRSPKSSGGCPEWIRMLLIYAIASEL